MIAEEKREIRFGLGNLGPFFCSSCMHFVFLLCIVRAHYIRPRRDVWVTLCVGGAGEQERGLADHENERPRKETLDT